MTLTSETPQEPPAPPVRPPFVGLNSRFLKRSVLATLLTLGLVAMTVAVYWSPAWAGYYVATGLWTLIFLALTPLIIKLMMFDRQLLLGLGLIGFKLLWLVLMVTACMHWSKTAASRTVLGTALVAGVTTPLLVLLLRALGAHSIQQRPAGGRPDQRRKVE